MRYIVLLHQLKTQCMGSTIPLSNVLITSFPFWTPEPMWVTPFLFQTFELKLCAMHRYSFSIPLISLRDISFPPRIPARRCELHRSSFSKSRLTICITMFSSINSHTKQCMSKIVPSSNYRTKVNSTCIFQRIPNSNVFFTSIVYSHFQITFACLDWSEEQQYR